jgi:hypothetical protein
MEGSIMKQKMFRLVGKKTLFLVAFLCICLAQVKSAASVVTITTVNQDTVEFDVTTSTKTLRSGRFSQVTFIFNSQFGGNQSIFFKIPAEILADENQHTSYVQRQASLLCEEVSRQQQQKAKICTAFLLQLALLGKDRALDELSRYVRDWDIGTPLICEDDSGNLLSWRDYCFAPDKIPGVTPANMLDVNENPSEDPTSIYEIFYFARSQQTSVAPQAPLASSLAQSPLPAELRARTLELEERLFSCERRMGLESGEMRHLINQLQQETSQLKDQNARLQQETSRLESQSALLYQRIDQLEARIAQLSTSPAGSAQAPNSPASSPVRPAPPPAPQLATPVLKQKNGQPITAIGQEVDFVGTCGYQGIGTPPEHQQDQTDTWMVVKVVKIDGNDHAMVVKQNPITVQRYKAGGGEARYDQSDLKVSLASWYSMVASKRIGSFPVSDFVLPVKLNGESQSTPFGRNLSDQSHYPTTVDPTGSVQAFVPSYPDLNPDMEEYIAVGKDTWTNFVSGFSNSGGQYPNLTWLRSPLDIHIGAAGVNYAGHIYSYSVLYITFALRPAFWVNI